MASRIFMSAVVIGSCMMACAEETVPSFATPREAGFAWQLQGEYDGELNDEERRAMFEAFRERRGAR